MTAKMGMSQTDRGDMNVLAAMGHVTTATECSVRVAAMEAGVMVKCKVMVEPMMEFMAEPEMIIEKRAYC